MSDTKSGVDHAVREMLVALRLELPAAVWEDVYARTYALLVEYERLREILRVREESQIPMIPRAAKKRLDAAEADRERLREQVRLSALDYEECAAARDIARDEADRAWSVLDWLAENNPAALKLSPYKAKR